MLPTRLPVQLPSSPDAGSGAGDVRPIAQWVEPARSGAGLAVTSVDLTTPEFYYSIAEPTGTLSSIWIRRDGGPVTDVVTAALNVNFVYAGSVVIASGATEAELAFGTALSPGDSVMVFMFGGNQTVVSGVVRTPSRLFRLLPAALGKVWLMGTDGTWVAPPTPYAQNGTWALATGEYTNTGAAWARLI